MMNINLNMNVGDIIYTYDLDDNTEDYVTIDSILITKDRLVFKDDSFDDICTPDYLDSKKPDCMNKLYFSSKGAMDNFIILTLYNERNKDK